MTVLAEINRRVLADSSGTADSWIMVLVLVDLVKTVEIYPTKTIKTFILIILFIYT